MRIGLDIETTLDHKKIHVVKTIDIETGEVKTWNDPRLLQEYVKDATLIIAHNGIGFDFRILRTLWNIKIEKTKTFDTLVVSRLLDPSRESGHSLEAWGKTLGTEKIPYSKIWEFMMDRREEYSGECFDRPIMPLLEYYCEGDVVLLRELFLHLEAKVQEDNFSQQSLDLEHEVAYICTQMEENGYVLDRTQATVLVVEWKSKLSALLDRSQELYPPVVFERISEKTGKKLKDGVVTFNLGSRQQIGTKLKELGYKPQKFTETGQVVVDEAVLEEIIKGNPSEKLKEFAELVKDYLLLQKRISQVESWLEVVKPDGRVHGRIITNGAVTGRATHMSPNMAQVPNTSAPYGAECRSCWTVEDGNEQVGVDLSGIELRCLAHYMQDASWTEELLKGDVHWKNCQAFGLVPMGTVKTDAKEHKDARNDTKTLTYALIYGAGDTKLGSIVKGTASRGAKLRDNFLRNTPGMEKLMKKLQPYIKKGYVPGLDGRKVWIRSDHAALNSLLQSAGAIIAKQWLVCATENLEAKNIPYKLLAWVHDELQFETPKGCGQELGRIVAESARQAGEILKFRCPVDAEFRVGANWLECH
jgi:DNA polymerase-1